MLSAFHAFILLADGYIGYNLNQLLIPFASANFRPVWVGLGQISFYLMVFAVFGLGMLHGLMSGADTAGLPMLLVYRASAVSVITLVLYRLQLARAKAQRQPARA